MPQLLRDMSEEDVRSMRMLHVDAETSDIRSVLHLFMDLTSSFQRARGLMGTRDPRLERSPPARDPRTPATDPRTPPTDPRTPPAEAHESVARKLELPVYICNGESENLSR